MESAMRSFQTSLYKVFPEAEGADWAPSQKLLEEYDRRTPDYSLNLRPRIIRESAHWASLPSDWDVTLQRAAEKILGSKNILMLFSLVSELLIVERERFNGESLKDWPDPVNEMGEDAPVFYLLITLNCIPLVRDMHKKMNIPEEITRDTCVGIGTKCLDYYLFKGTPGVFKWAVYWFQHHLDGELFRVGRLEYMIKKLHKGMNVYRKDNLTRLYMNHPESGRSIIVFPDGAFTEEPWDVSEKPPYDNLQNWPLILDEEDYVLDVHIPGGGKLSPSVIKDSFSRALEFFDRFFPEKKVNGFECISWIFSPDLEAAFDSHTNLIRFRDQVYLFPVETEKVDGLNFIYGTFSKDPAEWPENTSIQRRLKAHIQKGGLFRLSGMVYLREDLERYGEFPYRK